MQPQSRRLRPLRTFYAPFYACGWMTWPFIRTSRWRRRGPLELGCGTPPDGADGARRQHRHRLDMSDAMWHVALRAVEAAGVGAQVTLVTGDCAT